MTDSASHVTAADGTRLAYRRLGSGPRILTCVHSLALDGSWYAPLAASLGDDVTLLAPDLRGHGGSSTGPEPITLAIAAQDILAVWDAEGIERSPVMGISLGGMVAQAVSGTAPRRVTAQILAATRGAFDEESARAVRGRAEATRASGGLEAAADTTMERWFGDRAADPDDALVARGRAEYLRAGTGTIADCFEAMTAVGDFVPEPVPPTLVLGGDDDRSTPRPMVERLAADIPGAQLTFVPGGHLVAFENPDVTARVVRDFLDAHG